VVDFTTFFSAGFPVSFVVVVVAFTSFFSLGFAASFVVVVVVVAFTSFF
jgi:hypothetical protein